MATTEQISLCGQIFSLALRIAAARKGSIHVEYSAHIDALTVYKTEQPKGWDCNDRHVYLGGDILARDSLRELQMIKKDLESMLATESA